MEQEENYKCNPCCRTGHSPISLVTKPKLEPFSCETACLETFKCKFCYFETDFKIVVCRHETLVHGHHSPNPTIELKRNLCDKCDFETYSILLFARHLCENSTLSQYFRKTPSQRSLKTHISTKSEEGKWFECEQCLYKTKRISHLKRHFQCKHCDRKEVKWFECEQCPYKTPLKSNLKTHVLAKHARYDEVKWFECEQCSYKTRLKYNMRHHVLGKHSDSEKVKSFGCEWCSYKTKFKSSLKRHVLGQHLDPDEIEWFNCEQCQYKAKFKTRLKLHIRKQHLR